VNWLKKPSTTGGVVYLSVLAAVLTGIAVAATGAWRLGITMVGASFCVAFLARSVLPDERAGMLRIRRRFVDLTTIAFCALGMLVLAAVIPGRR
jgi:hypothetical protein